MGKRLLKWFTAASAGVFSHLKSIDFNGTNEVMKNTTNNVLGIGNAWTCMWWIKPTEATFASERLISTIAPNPDDGVNAIIINHVGNLANDPFVVTITSSDGGTIKSYDYDNLIVGNVWQQIVLIWDGTTLSLYKNGGFVSPSLPGIDDSGTMTDQARQVVVGSASSPALFWKGRAHSFAIWSVPLTAGNVTSIYNGGAGSTFDLSTIEGSSLQHWWLLGKEGDIGFDNGIGTSINFNANSSNITELDDAVTDSPS